MTGAGVRPPEPGEMLHGCSHSTACGRVREVIRRLDGPADWLVIEDWRGQTRGVRREPDGHLWELTWSFADD